MKLPENALIVIANGEKSLLLRNYGDAKQMNLCIVDHEQIDNPPTHEQGTDRPGRLPDDGHGLSAVQTTDWYQLEKQRLARELAKKLNHWALAQRFDTLVLVAAPSTLGEMRSELHEQVQSLLVAELDKDLTNIPLSKIEDAIRLL